MTLDNRRLRGLAAVAAGSFVIVLLVAVLVSTVVALVLSLLVLLLAAALLVAALRPEWVGRIRPGRPSQPSQPSRADQGGPVPGPGPAPGAEHDAGQAEHGTVQYEQFDSVQPALVRVLQQPGSRPWWEDDRPAGAAGRRGRAAAPRAVDLSKYLDQALIAQCPHCGSFRIDVDNRAAVWGFRCQECRQEWGWQPGTPWPAIHVRPNARRRSQPPRA
jgi:hypothetical protein